MTKVICFLNDGNIYFDCSGHSNYTNKETGNNDVCVAVSTLCSMLVRYMQTQGIAPEICEDGHILFKKGSVKKTTREVFEAVMVEMRALAEGYPDYVKVY